MVTIMILAVISWLLVTLYKIFPCIFNWKKVYRRQFSVFNGELRKFLTVNRMKQPKLWKELDVWWFILYTNFTKGALEFTHS